jgi:ribulose-5-phosphate 4-epimerase/fuculose-1-phosphate aldolase
MGNHGALIVGRTLPQAFERLYFLERAAQAQVLAMSTGRPLRPIPDAVIERACAQMQGGGAVGGFEREELHFDALKRMLDRAGMDYAS